MDPVEAVIDNPPAIPSQQSLPAPSISTAPSRRGAAPAAISKQPSAVRPMFHEVLSRHIAQLIQASADSKAGIAHKAELLELAKHCQVVPQNDFLLTSVARDLTMTVRRIFGPLALILVMTEPQRRQVYFAALARLKLEGRIRELERNKGERLSLIENLFLQSNEELITRIYGACPEGFLRLVTRLGDHARSPEFYNDLFKLLADSPLLAKPILAATQKDGLSEGLLKLLIELPKTPQAIDLASRFGEIGAYRRFMEPYRLLTGEESLREDHATRICAAESPSRLIERLYLERPFAPPVICAPHIRYVRNGLELSQIAKEFNNCMRNFVAEALKGEQQFFIWEKPGAAAVAFSIAADAPFGWHLLEEKLAKNEDVPADLQEELHDVLKRCGIRTNGSIERMMARYQTISDWLWEIDEA